MREIKFRAWIEMNTGGYMFVPRRMHLLDGEFTATDPESSFISKNVMQYTGFKDKNGTEIYEGDVIEFDRREWGGDGNIHVVSWDDTEGAWSWGGGSTSDMEWRTVIGNIYENPELVKS